MSISNPFPGSLQNPHYNPPGVPKIQLAREVPEDFLEHFRGKRKEERSWVHVDDPRLLEVEGAQLVFVGARDDRIGKGGLQAWMELIVVCLSISLQRANHQASVQ